VTARRGRRGAALFEVLVSMALFIGAAAVTLAAVRSALDALARERREQMALDLVRSTLAELEAGLISFQDLRDGERRGVGSLEAFEPSEPPANLGTAPWWSFDLESERTEFTGLSLVTLTVTEQLPDDSEGIHVTLRQLMPLRETDAEAFQEDEMLRDLPEGER
jgi:type II secretory pathway pseudopilin PulG